MGNRTNDTLLTLYTKAMFYLTVNPGMKVFGDQGEAKNHVLRPPGVAHQIIRGVFFT